MFRLTAGEDGYIVDRSRSAWIVVVSDSSAIRLSIGAERRSDRSTMSRRESSVDGADARWVWVFMYRLMEGEEGNRVDTSPV